MEALAGECGIEEVHGAEMMGGEVEKLVLVEDVNEVKHLGLPQESTALKGLQ